MVQYHQQEDTPMLDAFLLKKGFRRILTLMFDCIYANENLNFSWDVKQKNLMNGRVSKGTDTGTGTGSFPFVGIPIYIEPQKGKAPY